MRGRTDNTQRDIVAALRQVGVFVQDLSQVGKGCPDLLWSHKGRSGVIECKTGNGKLRPSQEEWRRHWSGEYAVAREPIDALEAVGIVMPREER